MNQAVSMCSLLLFFLQTNKPCSSFSYRMNPLKMSAIPPENASAAARRQPESNQLVTNKMCPFGRLAVKSAFSRTFCRENVEQV